MLAAAEATLIVAAPVAPEELVVGVTVETHLMLG
jgi:hypothetical protein